MSYIEQDLKQYNSEYYTSKNKMLELANSFLEANVSDCTHFKEKYPLNSSKETLEDRLKSFRREKALRDKIPAYYIFTDAELELILQNMPHTLDELKSLNVLAEVKIKCHGKDIVNVICDYLKEKGN